MIDQNRLLNNFLLDSGSSKQFNIAIPNGREEANLGTQEPHQEDNHEAEQVGENNNGIILEENYPQAELNGSQIVVTALKTYLPDGRINKQQSHF